MVLDNPVWWALTGHQRGFGTVRDSTGLFKPTVSPFGAFEGPATPAQWDDLAEMAGPGGDVVLMGGDDGPPAHWTVVLEGPGLQMVADRLPPPFDSEPDDAMSIPELLGHDDLVDMLALVDEARPGPFRERTHELGRYVGVRDGDRLVAMAGERLRLPGYTEISAVATLPSHRRRGLAAALVHSVATGIAEEGSVPFLSVAAQNDTAIRLYTALGFRIRGELHFRFLRAPGGVPPS